MTLELRVVPYDHPDATKLIDLVQAEYNRRYHGSGGDSAPVDPAQFSYPNGQFFVGYVDDLPAAMGGWRHGGPDGDTDAEIKRMYVHDDFRGRGLSRQVLDALERSAMDRGVKRLVPATGLAQPEAISLYTSSGYEPITPFGFYADEPDAVHLAKVL